MAVNDLSNQNIKDTYQRVIQTDGASVADGTGSLLPISFDGNNVIISGSLTATEYSVTSSVTNVVFQQHFLLVIGTTKRLLISQERKNKLFIQVLLKF